MGSSRHWGWVRLLLDLAAREAITLVFLNFLQGKLMNQINLLQKLIYVGVAIASIGIANLPATAADIKGFTDTGKDELGNPLTDAQCAVDKFCALSRGGVSDIMTLTGLIAGNRVTIAEIFAFGDEEAGNTYYINILNLTTTATPKPPNLLFVEKPATDKGESFSNPQAQTEVLFQLL
jgi:hypothetical protein